MRAGLPGGLLLWLRAKCPGRRTEACPSAADVLARGRPLPRPLGSPAVGPHRRHSVHVEGMTLTGLGWAALPSSCSKEAQARCSVQEGERVGWSFFTGCQLSDQCQYKEGDPVDTEACCHIVDQHFPEHKIHRTQVPLPAQAWVWTSVLSSSVNTGIARELDQGTCGPCPHSPQSSDQTSPQMSL